MTLFWIDDVDHLNEWNYWNYYYLADLKFSHFPQVLDLKTDIIFTDSLMCAYKDFGFHFKKKGNENNMIM